jgi:hypothetical protein
MNASNEYLQQVVEEQAKVEQALQRRLDMPAAAPVAAVPGVRSGTPSTRKRDGSAPPAPPPQAVDYRITGFGFWRTVIVPPNVYVVHTRRGHTDPLHIGLGISFRYNPYTDAFLVVPASVQTLLINARCICAERQGVVVQAYVQWIVEDIQLACRMLDFSDPADPMRIVNVQLREQAEAAIKDKVAMMSIDDILSDKQPIIQELTHRLRVVAEGSREGETSSGLGLKIVTVQIKEAVVSSTHLWENLQKPFRAEREKLARLAELEAAQQIARQEQINRLAREKAGLETEQQLAQLRAAQEHERYDRDQAENARRYQVEQEAEKRAIAERTATDKARKEAELELALHQLDTESRRVAQELTALRQQAELDRSKEEQQRLRTAAAIDVENLGHAAQSARTERELALFKVRREAENELSEQHVKAQLIARLPEIAAALPKPEELRSISIASDHGGTTTSLVGFLASLLQVAEGALKRPEQANGVKTS